MGRRVLVVDGPGEGRDSLAEALGRRGHELALAGTPEEARAGLGSFRPDLVIINVLLPGADGLGLLKSLRSLPEGSGIPFLVLALTQRASRISGPSAQIADCLTKPVDLETLLQSVKKALGGPGRRILIAEDDPDLGEMLEAFLRGRGFEPLRVSRGDQVAGAVRREKPDLLLLDLLLPAKDGFQVLEDLRGDPSTAGLPVVVLSAMRFNAYQERGLLTGEPEIIGSDVPLEFILGIIDNLLKGSAPIPAPRPPVVLVADDQPEILHVLRDILEREGFAVRTAADGQEALEAIRREPPDMAVLDYQMPGKTGVEVCAELKNDPAFEYLPVVLLSGSAERDTRVEGLNLGADDFISKPIDREELLARLRMILKRTRGGLAANPLTHLPGNVSIETRIQEALARGGPLDVLYIDLNHFKSFNDAYGFEAGDRVIKATGQMLARLVRSDARDFLGHIGGDDFIVLTQPDRSEALCRSMLDEFSSMAPGFYKEEDRTRGYILSTDRKGQIMKFPLLSAAIGVVTNRHRRLESVGQISQIGAEVKAKAKALGGNQFYVDRRKE